jgi:hypothetical protein
MQAVLLSQSDREDEEPRLILLASLETDARNQISDIYGPIIARSPGLCKGWFYWVSVDLSDESKSPGANKRAISDTLAAVLAESVWRNAETRAISTAARIRTLA